MSITSELQFKARQDFDGTLDGFAAAVADLVERAKTAGAPNAVTWTSLHEGHNYSGDGDPRYVVLTCKWAAAAVPTAVSEEVGR